MKHEDSHLSDQQLLLDMDGELSPHAGKLVRTHLASCWSCRARRQEMENAIADFVRFQEGRFDEKLPPSDGPRALLKAQLAELAAETPVGLRRREGRWALAVAALTLTVLIAIQVQSVSGRRGTSARPVIVSLPDSSLTPGAATLASRGTVCAQANTKNKAVSVALQRKVFQEYGIPDAKPQAYEVDYLVTPALGGADDIRNLWPHSYSATSWNARVKDELEDRLREMVCDGSLDLAEAQQEIAKNWIAAYRKYFHTDRPLPEHGDRR
jgi:hypothetical protein